MQKGNVGFSAADFVALFAQTPSDTLVANLRTEVFRLADSDIDFPATRNDRADAPNCYLCCPSVAYVDYAREEMRNLSGSPAMKRVMQTVLDLAAPLMRATGFDHQVQPNNWLVATNVWCGLDDGGIARVTSSLCEAWPDRAIVWRSLNDVADAEALVAFASAGYGLYPARQIYLFDCRAALPKAHRDEKSDLKLMCRSDYAIASPEEMRDDDFGRIEALYAMLYLEKYTVLNPQYSAHLLRQMHERGMLRLFGLRNRADVLDGVIGFFERGDVMTAPILGYDTAIDQSVGLYRRLTAIGLQRARERRVLYNLSAGAAAFKRSRGGVPAIEYSAIYNRHLSASSRIAGWIIRVILARVGVPIMRRFRL